MNYLRHYELLINRAKLRKLEVYETHHIIPRCVGGTNDLENLVNLTPEEHYIAHQLLIKIYPGNPKLIYAAMMMTRGRSSNKIYGWLRRRFIEVCKKKTGSNNNSFGTMWITNGEVTLKVPKDTVIEIGWQRGRLLKKRQCVICQQEINRKAAKFCDEHRIYMKPEHLSKIKKPLARIEKNGIIKEVPRNQVPSYKSCGWNFIE
jgi:hypothetical protein